jgi:hemerythrin-like domain-containing protein
MSTHVTTVTRENWDQHPSYMTSGANFWLQSHKQFRCDCKAIIDAVSSDKMELAATTFGKFETFLEHHHAWEERFLVPLVLKKSGKSDELTNLTKHHEELARQLEKIVHLFENFESSVKIELVDCLSTFYEQLDKHFHEEEELCIPVVIEHGINEMMNKHANF